MLNSIKVDVSRTFQLYKDFDNKAMFDILAVYSYINPKVNYCQGMNLILLKSLSQ